MMNQYVSPEITVIEFNTPDVLTVSNGQPDFPLIPIQMV